jgi:hypothetical protein
MVLLPDFPIKPVGPVAEVFLHKQITTFHRAIKHVQQLPYGRIPTTDHCMKVLTEGKGTCSSKHALLKNLAMEHEFDSIRLMLGIFPMDADYAPKIAQTLTQYQLDYIPEAHNYLLYEQVRYDFTHPRAHASAFEKVLYMELEIFPLDILHRKKQIHQEFIQNWLIAHPHIAYTPDQIWAIREQCIQDLSR